MKKIYIPVFTIIIIISFMSFAHGEPAPLSSSIQSKNYRFDGDTSINGVLGSHSFFFNIDKNWTPKDCYLNLLLSQSNLIDSTHSTLTILINNSPVYSIFLSEKEKYKDELKVYIPLDKINIGFNEIKIQTYRRITDKPCTDDVNLSNWIVFHKESYVHLDFLYKDDLKTLTYFPYPYLRTDEDYPIKSIIMLSDNFKDKEATSALMLSSFFGSYSKNNNIELQIYKASDTPNRDKENIIYVGSSNNTPKEIMDTLSESEKNHIKNGAIIKKLISPYSNYNTMVLIIGDIETELLKATYSLCTPNVSMQLKSDTIIVNKNFEISSPETVNKENISFKDLGYDNILLEGSFRQQAVFNISIPKNKLLKDTSKINFKIRYSKNLNFEKSLVSIYINDTPIGSQKLNYNDSDDASFDIKIPKELRTVSNYTVRVAFDLYIKDEYCNFRTDKSPWAYISNESYFYLPYENKKDLLLEYYPNPFVNNTTYNNVTIVLPDKPNSKDITLAGNLCAFIGKDLSDIKNIDIVKGAEWINEKNKNIIVIGTGNSNSCIQELNKYMFIKFNKDFKSLQSNKELSLVKPYSENLCSIQLLPSPYDKTKSILLISGTNENSLYTGSKYLYNSDYIKALKGNAVTIDSDGYLKQAYFGSTSKALNEEYNKENFFKNITDSKQIQYFLIFSVSTLLLLGIAFLLIIKKYK